MLVFRLFALAAGALSVWGTYNEWNKLNTQGVYSTKFAVLLPLMAVMSVFVFLFPQYAGKPETTGAKVLVMLVFVIGVAAGVYNLYMMDPGMFGQ